MGKKWFIEKINKIDKTPDKQNHKREDKLLIREDKLLISEMKYWLSL